MARHNEVTLYGQVCKAPILIRENNDPRGALLRVLSQVMVMRGIRDFGAKDQRMRLDELIVMSGNQRIMGFMKDWRLGDIVSLRGALITNDFDKACTCSVCGHTQLYKGHATYVYPIYVRLMAQGYTQEQGLIELKQNAEVSNRITIIGKACDKPKIHAHEKSGTNIASYVVDIERKYRVREDIESNRHDFPVVKSYGEIALNDYLAIEAGGMVFIDGQLQQRTYSRKFICESCGSEIIKADDGIVEIVPYSTEYLLGCHTMDEVQKMREDMEEKKQQDTLRELFGDGPGDAEEDLRDTAAAFSSTNKSEEEED